MRRAQEHGECLRQLHNLKPHLQETFKPSRDSKFLEKLSDVLLAKFLARGTGLGSCVRRAVVNHKRCSDCP